MAKIRSTKTTIIFKGKRIVIDSKMEAREIQHLIRLEKQGVIQDLELQPQFQLQPSFDIFTSKTKNGRSKQHSISYTADAKYIQDGKVIIHEQKGFRTDVYKLRIRMFLYNMEQIGVDIFIEKGANYEHRYETKKSRDKTDSMRKLF